MCCSEWGTKVAFIFFKYRPLFYIKLGHFRILFWPIQTILTNSFPTVFSVFKPCRFSCASPSLPYAPPWFSQNLCTCSNANNQSTSTHSSWYSQHGYFNFPLALVLALKTLLSTLLSLACRNTYVTIYIYIY